MDTNKMREQFEKRIHQPAGSYWCEKDRTYRYEDYDTASSQIHECQWQAWIAAWQASREAVVVELPEALSSAALDEVEVAEALLAGQGLSNLAGAIGCAYLICKELPAIRSAIEAQGLKVAP